MTSPAYYRRAVFANLIERLEAAGIAYRVMIESRLPEQWGTALPAVSDAVRRGDLQVLMAVSCNAYSWRWMRRLPVPVVSEGEPTNRAGVRVDMRHHAEECVRRLAESGCRSLGVLLSLRRDQRHAGRRLHPGWVLFDTYRRFARKYQMRCDEAWLRGTAAKYLETADSAGFAYREFHRLWSLPERPEGLIVEPDSIAPGFLMALMERQVRVPEQLRVILHKNFTTTLFCPFPVTFAVLRESLVAEAMLKQARGVIDGSSKGPIDVRMELVDHPGDVDRARTRSGGRPRGRSDG
jgi:DNA-binding LacI/PurR family transcriptional regulator